MAPASSIARNMTEPRFLPDDDFAHIVRHAPLVAIDVVIMDPQGKALLGLRENEPAKGMFFVPGGVIRKNETIGQAFARILMAELHLEASIHDASFLGVFEHFYETNRFGNPEYGTHYVTLGYRLQLSERPLVKTDAQHSDVRWMSEGELVAAGNVHPNTLVYFR
jgi:colanic acid biosynthesis protein WcaH